MHYIVLDMEWNQPVSSKNVIREPIHLKGDIIQIGAVKLDEKFRFTDSFNIMVSPQYYKKMNYRVAELTMISNKDLLNGISFDKAFSKFSKWCGDDFCILTWGWDDIPMLEDNLTIYEIDKSWIPENYNIQPIFDAQVTKRGKQCSLATAMELVGETSFGAHDALSDAMCTAIICKHLDMENGIKNYVQHKRRLIPDTFVSDVKYKNYKEARKDKKLSEFSCQSCSKQVTADDWSLQRQGRYIASAKCVCGDEYTVKLKFRKNDDKTFTALRTITLKDIETDSKIITPQVVKV